MDNSYTTKCSNCGHRSPIKSEDWKHDKTYTCERCGAETIGYLFIESFDSGFKHHQMATWTSESVELSSNPRKHRNCLVGIDEEGLRHYFPVRSSKNATRAARVYQYAGCRGVHGEMGMTKIQVSSISDEQLKRYWKSSSGWHNTEGIHFTPISVGNHMHSGGGHE